MSKLDREFVSNKAKYILGRVGENQLPIKLLPVAKHQRVKRIELLPMIVEGCTNPVKGGFEIFIKNDLSNSINVNSDISVSHLRPRQLFTLAHEIAHTFFYNLEQDSPKVLRNTPKTKALESLCNYGAGQLLLPTQLLIEYIDEKNPATSNFVFGLKKKSGLSTEFIIHRLNEIECLQKFHRALILFNLGDSYQDARVKSFCFHPSLLPYLNRPQISLSLKEWSPTLFKIEELWTEPMWEQSLRRGNGKLILKKKPYPRRSDAFFLEIEVEP